MSAGDLQAEPEKKVEQVLANSRPQRLGFVLDEQGCAA
jgi:hypothetical protein